MLLSLLAVQGLVWVSRPRPSVLVISGPSREEQRLAAQLRRGLSTALEEATDCGHRTTPIGYAVLAGTADPGQQLRHDPRAGRQLALVVAPPGIDVPLYGRWAAQRSLQVLLPLLRGPALTYVETAPERQRLWPLSPARASGLATLAEAALELGWERLMLVRSAHGPEADLATTFLDRFETAGGRVVSVTRRAIQDLAGDDPEALELLVTDIDWLQPDGLALFAAEEAPVLEPLRNRLAGGESSQWSGGWVWPTLPRKESPRPALGLAPGTRGPGWDRFEQRFRRRWGETPGPVEASGYDTGQILVLAMARPEALSPESWLDPAAPPLPLCEAIRGRTDGQTVRPLGASSDLDLRPGRPPAARFLPVYQPAEDTGGVDS